MICELRTEIIFFYSTHEKAKSTHVQKSNAFKSSFVCVTVCDSVCDSSHYEKQRETLHE